MAKKIKSNGVKMEMVVVCPQPVTIDGQIVAIKDEGLVISYKKPRKSKNSTEYFAYSKMVAFSYKNFAEGEEVQVVLKPQQKSVKGFDNSGKLVASEVKGFVTVANKEKTLSVCQDYAIVEAADE